MCINSNEVTRYEVLNEFANKNAVVVLGSTFMHDVPVSELKQSFKIHSDIYNRSLTDMKVSEAKDVISTIMENMTPKKIVLQLGEVELQDEDVNITEVFSEMRNLMDLIRSHNKHCKIVLVSVVSDNAKVSEYNNMLEKLANTYKCQFADIVSGSKKSESAYVNAFMKLKYFISDDIADALALTL
ncbi:MAG: SGNH/GDSL hydrolase family protein [Saccharofermentans sp.]|nr:SGNH/GDSL hydrolase family protein [Saccharofermentans sp.]